MKRIVCGIGVVGLSLTTLFAQQKTNNKEAYAKALDVMGASMSLLDRYFVDTINIERISRNGINAMLESLDPYTEYYSREDNEKLKMLTTGEYAGIGAIITQRPDSTVRISEPMEGMPAAQAGLRAGDIILEIDGKDYRKSTSEVVSAALKGAPGSKISLLIQRPYEAKPRRIDFTRRKIVVNPVNYYGLTPGGHGYIALSGFPNSAASEVRKAFVDLQSKGIKGLVLDLRGNGGGLLDEAVKIVSMFVPEGTVVVSTKGRADAKLNETFRTKSKPLTLTLPLVVLVDGQSASSSEIVAGALQDLDRAVVIGQKSYGKGLVQSTLGLPHNGTLKLTTAKYYIPSGRCIQRLDYHEAREGRRAKETPDSLRALFHTAKGRPVRDAGGILPDVEAKNDSLPTMIYYLTYNPDVFDWITEYCHKHPTIAPAKDFRIKDADYSDFGKMLQEKKFDYDRQSLKLLERLREIAEVEGHLKRSSALMDSLKLALEPNLKSDLESLRPHVEDFLTTSILTRYYYRRGVDERELMTDKVVSVADKYLQDAKLYTGILAAPAVKEEPSLQTKK